jgi:cell division protein FtsW (lipid II flippase)
LRTEAALLLIASLATALGLLAVYLSDRTGDFLRTSEFRAGVVYCGTALAVWLSIRWAGLQCDPVIFPVVSMLGGIGLIVATRLQPDLKELRGFGIAIGERQLAYLVFGFLLIWAITVFLPNPGFLSNFRYTILFTGLGLLALTAIVGTEVNGARLWIGIGGVQIQTAELVKVALVIFLAAYLSENLQLIGSSWRVGRLNLPPIPYLAPMVLMWSLCLATLILLNDIGTALLFFLLFLVMLYTASGRASYVLFGLLAFVVGAALVYFLFGRVQVRIENWLDPWQDPFGTGYQQIQADYAIAGGGLLGVGPDRGEPWLIPEVQTDYVIAAIGEEWGMVGLVSLLALYFVLTIRGFLISRRAKSNFLKLFAVGLTASLSIQAIVIFAGVLRLLPLTGVTTPFVSYGGSSLLVTSVVVGLLLRISALQDTSWKGRIRPGAFR